MVSTGTTPFKAKDLIILTLKAFSTLSDVLQTEYLSTYSSFYPFAQYFFPICVFWLALSTCGEVIRCSIQFVCLLWYIDGWLWLRVAAVYEDTMALTLGKETIIAKDRSELLCMALLRVVAGIACILAPAFIAAIVGLLTIMSAETDSLQWSTSRVSRTPVILCFYAIVGGILNAVRITLLDANSMLEKTASLNLRGVERLHVYQRPPYLSTMSSATRLKSTKSMTQKEPALQELLKDALHAIFRVCFHYQIRASLVQVLIQIKIFIKYVIVKLVRHVVFPILTNPAVENRMLALEARKKALIALLKIKQSRSELYLAFTPSIGNNPSPY